MVPLFFAVVVVFVAGLIPRSEVDLCNVVQSPMVPAE